jgi:glycine cleavage system transcriptional repressor
MRENIVFTLTGPDRVGIVEDVTKMLLEAGGNVETSRMARLGGEFAILLLASLPDGKREKLESDVANLTSQGYKITINRTREDAASEQAGWTPYRIELIGADNEGIVHEVASYLSRQGINIESMETGVVRGSMSGTPLFSMNAIISVPPSLRDQFWELGLQDVENQLNVEIKVAAEKQ